MRAVNDAVTLLQELVAIDSTNPDLGSGAGEAEAAAAVADWLGGFGLEVAVEEIEPGRPNVTAVVPGTGGGRSLMLNACQDDSASQSRATYPYHLISSRRRCRKARDR